MLFINVLNLDCFVFKQIVYIIYREELYFCKANISCIEADIYHKVLDPLKFIIRDTRGDLAQFSDGDVPRTQANISLVKKNVTKVISAKYLSERA